MSPTTMHTPRLPRLALALTLAVPLLPLAACAPTNTNTTYSANEVGRTAQVTYGVIVSMRPVTVESQNTGLGGLVGAAAGATAGSYIGGDTRANILGAIAGGLVGAVAGNAVQNAAGKGQAYEFIIREDSGNTISVVQTDELNFAIGQRVVLTRGARTRIAPAS
jgi:outer membrane lipoprotein SlyB